MSNANTSSQKRFINCFVPNSEDGSKKKIDLSKFNGIFSPPRQSKNSNDQTIRYPESAGPSFA